MGTVLSQSEPMNQPERLVRKIELPESIIGLRDDGILHVYYKPYTEITPEYQARQLKTLNEISDGKHPAIYEAGEYVTVTSEARSNAIRLEAISPTLCKVVFVRSLSQKLIAQFYYQFNKPKQPYKVFDDFQQGIEWLHQTWDSMKK